MAGITFGGLASGLDTQALIRAILDFERQPVTRLQQRRLDFDIQRSALSELEGKVKELENSLNTLSSPVRFRSRTASVSDESVLRATTGSSSDLGLFDIEVTRLAEASRALSSTVAAPDENIVSAGQITIQAGSNDAITIDVSAANGNDNLNAIRDQINAADSGVRASTLFDGSGYRLVLRSEDSGQANSLSVTDGTNLNLGGSVTAGQDAALTIDGVGITSASNTVSGALSGVTLELLSTTPTDQPVTLEIDNDVDQVVENVQDLVTDYNDIISFFNEQFGTGVDGPLSGDSTARGIQQRLQLLFTGGVEGIDFGGIRSLSAVGVNFDGQSGEANLDSATLRDLLTTRFDEVGDLFLNSGRSTDPRLSFAAAGDSTLAGTYGVEITQAAERAVVSGSTAITTLGQNETLTIGDGANGIDVQLSAGQTVDEAVSAINTALGSSDVAALAVNDNGVLRIQSSSYGAGSSISVTSSLADPGDGTASGFTTTAATDSGVDVAGTINGETATGSGQILTSDAGDSTGLQVRITGTQTGSVGDISFSRGLVADLLREVQSITRLGDGEIEFARESLDNRIEQIDDDITRFEERLTIREQLLIRQFTAAEQAIASLQSQQTAFQSF